VQQQFKIGSFCSLICGVLYLQNSFDLSILDKFKEPTMIDSEWIIDGHVHIYPNFDPIRLFAAAQQNLLRHCTLENYRMALLLTERADCNFFSRLSVRPALPGGWSVEPTAEKEVLRLISPQGQPLLLFAGRQIVSKEGLEICSLASSFFVADRQFAAAEAVQQIRENGGLAALNWAPGKWFGKRGKTVDQLFTAFSAADLMISDTTMRPIFWPTPYKMQQAQKKGRLVIAGSDPLPFFGEESWVGRYAFCIKWPGQTEHPGAALREMLRSTEIKRVGRRSGITEFAHRQIRIMREKKERS